jgi:microsomal dipeptidase-like Zn-dependent dipeptidase
MVWGFADLHCHPMANLGFNGMIHGSVDGPIERALAPCDGTVHGKFTLGALGLMLMLEGTPPFVREYFRTAGGMTAAIALSIFGVRVPLVPPHVRFGHPNYGWPHHKTLAHQQMHINWIFRAFQGGLRLMVAHAVDNMLLSDIMNYDAISRGRQDRRFYSDVFSSRTGGISPALAQIEGMKRVVQNNNRFMGIATSPQEARSIINSGKLAVVLGIEVDNLVARNTNFNNFKAKINDLVSRGVRHFFPIHIPNNWFGGSAVYSAPNLGFDLFNTLNEYMTGQFWSIVDDDPDPDDNHPSKEVRFHLQAIQKRANLRTSRTLRPISRSQPIDLSHLPRDLQNFSTFLTEDVVRPEYTRLRRRGHINSQSLTEIGAKGIKHMMSRGLLIEIDHMSHRSADRTLSIAEGITLNSQVRGYPLVSGHTSFRELKEIPNETQLSRKQVERIRNLGGMVAPLVGPSFNRNWRRRVGSTPSGPEATSREWAQAYLYAVEMMGGQGVAIGSEFNGLLGKPAGRFRPYPTVADHSPIGYTPPRSYDPTYRIRPAPLANNPPLQISSVGQRQFDFNTEGLAHYGMLVDFLQDLKNIGLTAQDLSPLFRSAEDYIRMWEKCIMMSSSRDLDEAR